ncbi:MAG: GWxTD domain-containing protein [Bacteroidales bacterium]|nr:GWxTD domain-containing protein [Bacteroidales bacterium]
MMKLNYKLIYLLLVLSVFILFKSCFVQKKTISNRDLSYMYNPGTTLIHPEYFIYHNSDTTSQLFIKILLSELLFKNNQQTNISEAKISIFYVLYPSIEDELIKDSSTTIINLKENAFIKDITTYSTIKTLKGEKYILDIKTTDLFGNVSHHTFIDIDKSKNNTSQNYLITSVKDNKPVFRRYFTDDAELLIIHNDKSIQQLYVYYYNFKFPPAKPPFSSSSEKVVKLNPDSLWIMEKDNRFNLKLKNQGIYNIKINSSDTSYFTLYSFNKHYPRFKTPEQLVKPLIYLTSYKEYKNLLNYDDPKLAVDSFWLKTSGNVDRAKELIRVYYNRAQLANYYFTSYKEGWKTDRGMIYTIFGTPTTIFVNNESETWSYGRKSSSKSLEFVFYKTSSEFENNDYILLRSDFYDRLWFNAVDSWRNGQAFSVENE